MDKIKLNHEGSTLVKCLQIISSTNQGGQLDQGHGVVLHGEGVGYRQPIIF